MIFDIFKNRRERKLEREQEEEQNRQFEKELAKERSERYWRHMEWWRLIINTQTDRVASLDEFDDTSIETIYHMMESDHARRLIREQPNQVYSYQAFRVAGDWEDTARFYMAMCYPNRDAYDRHVYFGYYSEGFDVIKSRYNLLDTLLSHRTISPQAKEKRKDLRKMILSLNEENK